jgi:molybdopterin synthase sulfur carrier subunit
LWEVALPIIVRIPPPLRKYTGGAESVETMARNLAELLDSLTQKYPGFKQTLCTPDGTLQRFMNIYVNDEDIRFLGGATYAFQDGDEVLLIPAIAGGSPPSVAYVVATDWPG